MSPDETKVQMTIHKLCRAVAGKMGIEDGWWCEECQDYVDGRRVTFEETHEVCGFPVIDKDLKLASGDGMLKVLEWLTCNKICWVLDEDGFGIWSGVETAAEYGRPGLETSTGPHPVRVLCGFMWQVEGVSVELVGEKEDRSNG